MNKGPDFKKKNNQFSSFYCTNIKVVCSLKRNHKKDKPKAAWACWGDYCLFTSLKHIIIHATCQQISRWPTLTSSTGCSSVVTTTDSAWRVFAKMLPKRVPSICTPIWTSFNVSTHHNCHDKDLTVNSGNSHIPEEEASLLPLPEGYFGPVIVVMSREDPDWSGALTETRPRRLLWSNSTEPVMFIGQLS